MGKVNRIGLDLDNTVIDYAQAYPAVASVIGLPQSLDNRHSIRGILRKSDQEDLEWQRFQSILYTDGLTYAQPASGLMSFLSACSTRNIEVSIISHKTSETPEQFGSRDLHTPALQWLRDHGLVPNYVDSAQIYFCETRADKLKTISSLELDVFVDDLLEVLEDPLFPASTRSLHYTGEVGGLIQPTNDLQTVNFSSLTHWIESC